MHEPPSRTVLAIGGLVMAVAAGISTLPVLAHSPRPAVPAAAVAATARPAVPMAMPIAPVTYANGLVVGPGAACCFLQSDQWTAGQGGQPAFGGPARWSASGTASFQWSLGAPGGGQRWDQVRVQAWIPNAHAVAWVRYTVTSSQGGAQAVHTFDVAQEAANGWFTLPATFQIGTPTQRTGTVTVLMTYLRGAANTAAGRTEMGAAQVRFQWS